jgi:hypothetical protein
MKPPIDTMMAIAMIRGRKIWRMPISRIWGFFSGSAIEDAGECGFALKRSSIAIVVKSI